MSKTMPRCVSGLRSRISDYNIRLVDEIIIINFIIFVPPVDMSTYHFLVPGLFSTFIIYLLIASFSITSLFLFQMKSGVLVSISCLFMQLSNIPIM